jgi:hypothetical protein
MLGGLLVALVAPAGAHARSTYLSSFNSRYGTATTRLDSCNTCHGSSTQTFNPYGADVLAGMGSGIANALSNVESTDSDGDGFTNLTEIQALTFPGNATDKPVTEPTACPDGDGDGYAVCDGTCVPPAAAACGDCNDSNAAVNPGAAEGPFGSATCNDAIDNDCSGAVDSADAACAPLPSDYDIVSLSAPAAGIVRQPMTLSVTIANPGTANPGGSITVYGQLGRKTIQVARDQIFSVAPGATATLTFTVKPRAVGTVTWFAVVTDGDPDADEASATTVITRK